MGVSVGELAGVPFFRRCSPETLAALAPALQRHTYLAGELLFGEGERPEGLFAIGDGRVSLFRASPDGREVVVCTLVARQCCAGCPLIDGGSATVGARAAAETTVYVLPTPAATAMIAAEPSFASALLQVLGGRLRHLVRVADGLALMCVRQRLANVLLDSVDRDGARVLAISQEELAAELATAPEVVRRAMQQLRAAGAVRSYRRRVEVDPEVLARLAQGESRGHGGAEGPAAPQPPR